MVKKYSKFLLVFLCAFFVAITPSFAREMTEDELEEVLETMSPDTTYLYVIGEYGFTSLHEFTREDSMLAARSIKVVDVNGKTNKDPIYKEMTMYKYSRVMDDDFNPIGIEFETNLFGESVHPEKLEIKYIDYKYVPEPSNAEIKPADENAYNEIKNDLGINFKNDSKIVATTNANSKRTTLLTGVISPNDEIDESIFPAEDLTGFYYAFTVEGLTDESVVTVEGAKKKTFTKDDFTNGRLVMLMALHPGLDILGRNITVTVDIDGAKETYGDTVYTIDYSELVFEGATTELLTEDSGLYELDDVKNFLTQSKYDFSKTTGLKLENGKLTGKILYNGEVGKEFSSRPEDITGYYFPYVLTLDGELTDKSVITIPGNGGRKTVTLGEFDDKDNNRVVILTAISPLRTNKVIDIIVDLDGDGDKYAPRTYTIDYSEVQFDTSVGVSTLESLNTALDDETIETVVLSNNIETDVLAINHDKKINLNGKEIKAEVKIIDDANVEISNGKIVAVNGSGVSAFDDADVVIDNVTIESKLMGIGANATRPYKKLEIRNSTIKSVAEPAIFFPGSSIDGKTPELVVTDSTLEGISGIDARSGKITISGSTITALGNATDWEYVKNHDAASGTTDGAAALYLHSQSPYSNGGSLSVVIRNSELTNKNNDKGVIRVYEHGAAGVSTISVDTDKNYTITEELREEPKVSFVLIAPEVSED